MGQTTLMAVRAMEALPVAVATPATRRTAKKCARLRPIPGARPQRHAGATGGRRCVQRRRVLTTTRVPSTAAFG